MNIQIKNCNNIETGEIDIIENQLNIKYGINGTGKTTIAEAISRAITDKESGKNSLIELIPFKYFGTEENVPVLSGINNINSVAIFNEEYVNSYIFLEDELLKGSFDVFIRTDEYIQGLEKIEELIESVQTELASDIEIDELILDLEELNSAFGKPTKSGNISGTSKVSKAFKNGNKVINIPEELEDYSDFIQIDENYKWIKWQVDGNSYLEISDKCPFCTGNIRGKEEKIRRIEKEYDSKSIENLNIIVNTFQKLKKYFSEKTNEIINSFVSNIDGYSDEQIRYLAEIRSQIELLSKKLKAAKTISFQSLREVDKLIEDLNAQKIQIELLSHLQSEYTLAKVKIVNDSLDSLLDKVYELRTSVAIQNSIINRLVNENKKEMNEFLMNAGYSYSVDIIEDNDGIYKLKLIHNDINNEVTQVKLHLSYGERNAFALVLFMYAALKNTPDLIVLDDPISSFDKNKKFAIIDMLFRKQKFLRGKTALLFTHDFDPVVDMVVHHANVYEVSTAFLENNHGVLTEQEISREDIKTFIDVCKGEIKDGNEITRLVFLRRYYEIHDEKGLVFQLLSNLFHKREMPILRFASVSGLDIRYMYKNEIKKATEEIQKDIPEFNFQELVSMFSNDLEMKKKYFETNSSYEKLHIYRILVEDKDEGINSKVIMKFVHEAFHIENNSIYQLDPCKYQLVPQYVIDACDEFISELNV